ncbi:MAG: PLP-dependent aminotransferase family protein [Acidobacteriaceae bacterium]|nr:PLP-dependent aminotransferase family protein [Acidobacteriaceae bacterium]
MDGVLSPGDRLPSTRQAASDYGVSRGLMEEVFGQLADERLFERVVGRGTYVSPELARLNIPANRLAQESPSSGKPSIRGAAVAANAACREPEAPVAFNAGIADTSQFPWKLWCRLQARAARELGPAALSFADPRGLPNLRTSIARYLGQFRGIHCRPNQVIIFNSTQQALTAIAVLLVNAGDVVWIEDPCYPGARAAFDLTGAKLGPVSIDEDGFNVKCAMRCAPQARLVYVTPPHQYPTGVALRMERRIELVEWAERSGSWILEDDYDGEFRYAGQPLTSIYSLSSRKCVLYLGTLNKSTFASLRLAYVVAPEDLIEPLANVRTQMDGFTPALTQMAMSLFMDDGHFSSHLRRMRAVYNGKRKMLLDELAPMRRLGWTWSDNPAGMHLLLRHKNGSYVREIAKASSLRLALLSSYRTEQARDNGLFLRFGALDPEALQAGVEQLLHDSRRATRK